MFCCLLAITKYKQVMLILSIVVSVIQVKTLPPLQENMRRLGLSSLHKSLSSETCRLELQWSQRCWSGNAVCRVDESTLWTRDVEVSSVCRLPWDALVWYTLQDSNSQFPGYHACLVPNRYAAPSLFSQNLFYSCSFDIFKMLRLLQQYSNTSIEQ